MKFIDWEIFNKILACHNKALSSIASTKNKFNKLNLGLWEFKKCFSRVCVDVDKKPTAHGYHEVEWDPNFFVFCHLMFKQSLVKWGVLMYGKMNALQMPEDVNDFCSSVGHNLS